MRHIQKFLTKFKLLDKLKLFYAQKIISDSERDFYGRMYSMFEINHKGFLSKSTFEVSLRRMLPDLSETDRKNAFTDFDIDNNGIIEFDEFIVAYISDEDINDKSVLRLIFNITLSEIDSPDSLS